MAREKEVLGLELEFAAIHDKRKLGNSCPSPVWHLVQWREWSSHGVTYIWPRDWIQQSIIVYWGKLVKMRSNNAMMSTFLMNNFLFYFSFYDYFILKNCKNLSLVIFLRASALLAASCVLQVFASVSEMLILSTTVLSRL